MQMPSQSSCLSHHHPFPLHGLSQVPPTWERSYYHCKMSIAKRAGGASFKYIHTHIHIHIHIYTHTLSLKTSSMDSGNEYA